jgi:hypothetical protein
MHAGELKVRFTFCIDQGETGGEGYDGPPWLVVLSEEDATADVSAACEMKVSHLTIERRQTLQRLDRIGVMALVGPERGGEIGNLGDEPIVAETAAGPEKGLLQALVGRQKVVGNPKGIAQFGPGSRTEVGERLTAVTPGGEKPNLANRELSEPEHLWRGDVTLGVARSEKKLDASKTTETGELGGPYVSEVPAASREGGA